MSKKKLHEEASPHRDATAAIEMALQETDQGTYVLRLYVSGMTSNSLRAIKNIRRICAEHLEGRHQLEIIDIYQQPFLAKEGQVVAAPTLVKELPLPLRRCIGDLSQTERVLMWLDVRKMR